MKIIKVLIVLTIISLFSDSHQTTTSTQAQLKMKAKSKLESKLQAKLQVKSKAKNNKIDVSHLFNPYLIIFF